MRENSEYWKEDALLKAISYAAWEAVKNRSDRELFIESIKARYLKASDSGLIVESITWAASDAFDSFHANEEWARNFKAECEGQTNV